MTPPPPPRPWFWQLAAGGHGPDWFLTASVAPGDAPALAAALRRHAPPGLVPAGLPGALCSIHGRPHDYAHYADPGSARRLAARLRGEPPENIWVYHSVECCGPDLRVERGYGGFPGEAEALAETALIRALASALALTGWAILAGGQGYNPWVAARGADSASLLAYLGGEAAEGSPVSPP